MATDEVLAPVVSPAGIRAAGLSHVGCARDHDEDAFAVVPALDLYLVTDGMGGQSGGEVASRVVVEVLPNLLRKRLRDAAGTADARRAALRRTLLELNATVRREATRWEGLAGMGATIVLALADAHGATIAHMGDSRAYLFRDDELQPLTHDHSLLAALIASGEITEEDARDSPARGRITRFLGMEGDVGPDVATVGLAPGDRLLLCSDGLVDALPEAAIAGALAQATGDPEGACHRLLGVALEAGAADDVTALVADKLRGRTTRGDC